MTRSAIATLTIALTAAATAAWAQTEATPAPAPMAAPAPAPAAPTTAPVYPAPAPTATAPAPAYPAPAPAAAPTTAPVYPAPAPAATAPATAPVDPMAAPAAQPMAAPAEPAPPPPPPPPPTGDALYLLQALDSVCTPLINKADMKALAKSTGYKRNARDGSLTLKLEGGKSIVVSPPSAANPTVCRILFNFGVEEWRPMVEALNNWSYARTPPLQLLYQGYKPINGSTTTWSWEVNSPQLQSGLAFNLRKNADGAPSGKGGKTDVADVVFSYSVLGQ